MRKAIILGISGSQRKDANTTIAVQRALEAAGRLPGIETRLYQFCGKKMKPCTDCGKCCETGHCSIDDDVDDFVREYWAADGVIWGALIYVMSVPANMKAAIDRMANSEASYCVQHGTTLPRPSKVCGVLAVGRHRNGGAEMTLSYQSTPAS